MFGLIKDSIVINRVKREKKEIEVKRIQMVEVLKRRKSTIFMAGALASHANVDTERDVLRTRE